MPRHIVIDTDPGADDAVALLWAFAAPEALSIEGVIAVAGNLPVSMTLRNVCAVAELAGRSDIGVYGGSLRPLMRPLIFPAAQTTGGLATVFLPEPHMRAKEEQGVDFLIETLRGKPKGSITLCALGPLTNIALALLRAPDVAARIAELVIMGGAAFEIGNITPAAEFNIHCDPHSAAIVFESGIPITLVPLDLTHQVLTTGSRLAHLEAIGNRCGPYAARLLAAFEKPRTERFGDRGKALHDPCVIGYVLHPGLFKARQVNVVVETASPLGLGMTVVDWWGVTERTPNVRLLHAVDADGLYDLLSKDLARLP